MFDEVDKKFIKDAGRIFERVGADRYSKPLVTAYYDSLSVYGIFSRQQLIRIAEGILELEGFVMVRAATRRTLLKEIARHFSGLAK